MTWPETTRRNDDGVLMLGGISAPTLARTYGTPLYVYDEVTLRNRARSIRDAFAAVYPRTRVVYAGKANLSPALVRVLAEEELGLDVVSGGEIAAGLLAGVDPALMVFHGNNKSRQELEEAVDAGIGLIAVDNELEIERLSQVAEQRERLVDVVLRLNPGVDAHTHDKMRTGAEDSKFGFPIWDGQAEQAADRVVAATWLKLVGYHAHVGSQIFDSSLVAETIGETLVLAARVRDRFGICPEIIIPGGGFGVADDASGRDVSIQTWAEVAAAALKDHCTRLGFALPLLVVEPGRAIVGPAGVAIYEVGARKAIDGVRTYVSVDGGMADNIRPTLYGARYAAALANRDGSGDPIEVVTIAGKYCESGDLLIQDIALPVLRAGDLLAVPMTGAYCMAMASNYNFAPKPAVVMVNAGQSRLIRRRETYADMLRAEVISHDVAEPPEQVGELAWLSAGKRSL